MNPRTFPNYERALVEARTMAFRDQLPFRITFTERDRYRVWPDRTPLADSYWRVQPSGAVQYMKPLR